MVFSRFFHGTNVRTSRIIVLRARNRARVDIRTRYFYFFLIHFYIHSYKSFAEIVRSCAVNILNQL